MSAENTVKSILLRALKLSENEKAVLGVLERQKMARNVSKIARDAGIPRTTAIYILQKFSRWKIVRRLEREKHTLWLYDKRMNFNGHIAR